MNKQRPQYNKFNKGNNGYQQKTNSSDNHNNQQHQSANQNDGGPHQNNPFSTPPTLTEPVRSGPCVACKSTTVLICQRCSDFYCSIKCQTKDWPQHRYICFKMPSLVHSSTVSTETMPPLTGYMNKELPPTVSFPNSGPPNQQRKLATSDIPSQQQQDKRKLPSAENNSHTPTRSSALEISEQQNKKRSPPTRSEKSVDLSQPALTACNIGKVQQVEFPKNNTNILVTAFRSSNRLFLRSMEKKDNEGYCDVIKNINQFGKTAAPLKTMPLRNAFAITDFNNDGLYYRVQVVAVKDENNIRVIYYDFGNEDTKKLSQLKEISKACAELKQYIVPATLRNVPFIRDSEKLDEYVKSFEDTEGTIVLHKDKERTYCEIFPKNSEKSINQSINAFIKKLKDPQTESSARQDQQSEQETQKQPQPLKQEQEPEQKQQVKSSAPQLQIPSVKQASSVKNRPSQLSKAVMVPPFEMVPFPVEGKNLNVLIVDNSLMAFGYVGCMLVEDKANLQAIQQYLSEYEDNGQPYKPKIEEFCLGKYEDCWYRAKVVAVASEKCVEVVFIDFLNECTLEISNIRRYPMDLDYPCKSCLCLLEELPSELSGDLEAYLKEKLRPGSEHKIIEVKGLEEDDSNVVLVKMDKVTKWLSAHTK